MEAEASPLPSDETTPPVTKMYLVAKPVPLSCSRIVRRHGQQRAHALQVLRRVDGDVRRRRRTARPGCVMPCCSARSCSSPSACSSGDGGSAAKRSSASRAVGVEADVLARQAARDGRAAAAARGPRRRRARRGWGCARSRARRPRASVTTFTTRGESISSTSAQGQRERATSAAPGRQRAAARPRRSPAGSSMGSSPCTFTTIVGVDARAPPPPAGRCRWRGRARSCTASPPKRAHRVARCARRRWRPARGRRRARAARARRRAGSSACRGCPREASPEAVWNRSARG